MAEPRSKRTGEHNAEIVKLLTDAASMRERMQALEARVLRLEAELASAKNSARPPAPTSIAPRPSTKRPAGGGPPPLPSPSMMPVIPKQSGRRSVVDISEIAELVESMPPPAPRSKK